MRIERAKRETSLDFSLTGDGLDGVTSIDQVWFKFDRPVSLDPSRVALMSYLLCEDLIGNVFECVPEGVPANLAASIQQSFAGHELFVSPVTNEARRLTFEPKFQSLAFVNSDAAYAGLAPELAVVRTAVGYDIRSNNGKELVVSTNLPLFLALTSRRPKLLQQLLIYLLVFDTLKPGKLLLDDNNIDGDVKQAQGLFSEVGGLIQHGHQA